MDARTSWSLCRDRDVERYAATLRLKDARQWLLHVQSDLAVVRRKEWALPISVENAELRVKAALDGVWDAQCTA